MQIIPKLHGFFWESMTWNNCNICLIEGSGRLLIDPGPIVPNHAGEFGHAQRQLKQISCKERYFVTFNHLLLLMIFGISEEIDILCDSLSSVINWFSISVKKDLSFFQNNAQRSFNIFPCGSLIFYCAFCF